MNAMERKFHMLSVAFTCFSGKGSGKPEPGSALSQISNFGEVAYPQDAGVTMRFLPRGETAGKMTILSFLSSLCHLSFYVSLLPVGVITGPGLQPQVWQTGTIPKQETVIM